MPKYVRQRLLLMVLVFASVVAFLSSSNCPESVFRCDWTFIQYGLLGLSAVGILLLAILED